MRVGENKINENTPQSHYIIDGRVIFNPHSSDLVADGKKIPLSFTESNTLELMLQNAGDIIDKERIKSYSWQGRIVTDSSIVKLIANLRVAFKEASIDDGGILTIPRMGYKFTLSVIKVENTSTYQPEPQDTNVNELKNAVSKTPESVFPENSLSIALVHQKRQPLWKIKKPYRFNIKNTFNIIFYCIGFILIPVTIYNTFFKIDVDLNKDYISSDFSIKTDKNNREAINVIYPRGVDIDNYFVKLREIAPAGSIVFINDVNDVINVGYLKSKSRYHSPFTNQITINPSLLFKGNYQKDAKYACNSIFYMQPFTLHLELYLCK